MATTDIRVIIAACVLLSVLLPLETSFPSQSHSICPSGSYRTVNELYEYCKVPGECNVPLSCEGKGALIKGAIDYGNIFEHREYPQVPYEKFFLTDGNKTLEVLAVSTDNTALFDKIYQARKNGKKEVYVKGIIKGIDEPIMGKCRRGIRLESDSPDSIRFR